MDSNRINNDKKFGSNIISNMISKRYTYELPTKRSE
jgi:hypothetical protein